MPEDILPSIAPFRQRGAPGDERHHDDAAVRPDGGRSWQHRRAWPCQRDGAGPDQGDGLLSDGAWPDARSVFDGGSREHVGECRARPVPFADPRAAGGARHHRAGAAGPGCTAETFGIREKISGRDTV